MTQVVKINLLEVDDAAKAIQDACTIREAVGLLLRGMFENGGDLVMVFQTTFPDQPTALPPAPPNTSRPG